MTLCGLFQESVSRHGGRVALRFKEKKTWRELTYAQLAEQVQAIAAGLDTLGIVPGDRIAILSENRPEWAVTDLAALHLGATVVPIYPTLPAPQVAYIVGNSGARLLVVSDAKQLKKALDVRASVPSLEFVLVFDSGAVGVDDSLRTYPALLASGHEKPLGARFETLWKAVGDDDLASLVYTSGTTGDPKGAMLTHGNFASNALSARDLFAAGGYTIDTKDTFLSFLPVCHAFERTAGYYLPLACGATIAYSDGVRTLTDEMQQIRPTLMVCVPRVYEAIQERILDAVAKAPANRQALFQRALAVGMAWVDGKRGPILALQRLVFEKLVYAKARERFGGKFAFFVAGGAALSPATARFFGALGLPVMEGYGMTEASPVMSCNRPGATKLGTVGTVLPGGTFRIAADGEILYKGPNVMPGYWKNDTATAEVIDTDGWLHTGDIGVLDAEGFLKITDRKKDIIVLANGKNVAPQPIEQTLKQSPFLSEIVLIGDQQSVVTALVVPNREKLKAWAKEQGLSVADDVTLFSSAEAKKKLKAEIDAHSAALADFERVKKFAVIDATFSIEGGELTPTLKVKRKVIAQRYAAQIAELRGDEATG
jgi:long-chain acyl-CoA synthetase